MGTQTLAPHYGKERRGPLAKTLQNPEIINQVIFAEVFMITCIFTLEHEHLQTATDLHAKDVNRNRLILKFAHLCVLVCISATEMGVSIRARQSIMYGSRTVVTKFVRPSLMWTTYSFLFVVHHFTH